MIVKHGHFSGLAALGYELKRMMSQKIDFENGLFLVFKTFFHWKVPSLLLQVQKNASEYLCPKIYDPGQ